MVWKRKIRKISAVHHVPAKTSWGCDGCGLALARGSTCACGGKAVRFASRREAVRWRELKLLERAGQIADLRRQVRYELIPKGYTMTGRARYYTADFVYREGDRIIIEDVKGGAATRESMLRIDLLRWRLAMEMPEGEYEVRVT